MTTVTDLHVTMSTRGATSGLTSRRRLTVPIIEEGVRLRGIFERDRVVAWRRLLVPIIAKEGWVTRNFGTRRLDRFRERRACPPLPISRFDDRERRLGYVEFRYASIRSIFAVIAHVLHCRFTRDHEYTWRHWRTQFASPISRFDNRRSRLCYVEFWYASI